MVELTGALDADRSREVEAKDGVFGEFECLAVKSWTCGLVVVLVSFP